MNLAARAFVGGLLAVGLVMILVAVVLMGREHEHRAEHMSAPPHVERPTADATQHQPDFDMQEAITAVQDQRWVEYLEGLARAREAAARASASRHAATSSTVPRMSAVGGFLACVKYRESRGDYRSVNPSSGTGGAYQFTRSTWDATAGHAGRADLVGVRPQDASPADQDQLARVLFAWQGRGPWAGGSYSC